MKKKIYDKVVISMDTLETIHEESHEYDGDVAECKGGGGDSVDKAYNSRMAAIAEIALGQSMMSENERKYGFRPGSFVSNMDKQVFGYNKDKATGSRTPFINTAAISGAMAAPAPTVTSAAAMQQRLEPQDYYSEGK